MRSVVVLPERSGPSKPTTRAGWVSKLTSSTARIRPNQLTHPGYAKPELLATRPNELWSWDVSKLKGPAKWTYFYLYVACRS
jgi:hypothetical protein